MAKFISSSSLAVSFGSVPARCKALEAWFDLNITLLMGLSNSKNLFCSSKT
jgi:hypothetical protein